MVPGWLRQAEQFTGTLPFKVSNSSRHHNFSSNVPNYLSVARYFWQPVMQRTPLRAIAAVTVSVEIPNSPWNSCTQKRLEDPFESFQKGDSDSAEIQRTSPLSVVALATGHTILVE